MCRTKLLKRAYRDFFSALIIDCPVFDYKGEKDYYEEKYCVGEDLSTIYNVRERQYRGPIFALFSLKLSTKRGCYQHFLQNADPKGCFFRTFSVSLQNEKPAAPF